MFDRVVVLNHRMAELSVRQHAVENIQVLQRQREVLDPRAKVQLNDQEVFRRPLEEPVHFVDVVLENLQNFCVRLGQSFYQQMHPERQLCNKLPKRMESVNANNPSQPSVPFPHIIIWLAQLTFPPAVEAIDDHKASHTHHLLISSGAGPEHQRPPPILSPSAGQIPGLIRQKDPVVRRSDEPANRSASSVLPVRMPAFPPRQPKRHVACEVAKRVPYPPIQLVYSYIEVPHTHTCGAIVDIREVCQH